jgi:glycogen debranching enzyme
MNESSRPPQAPDQPPFDDYHIEAAESLVERTLRTLKHGDVFAVFDQQGNLQSGPSGPDGIYYRDTRYLSHFHVKIGGCEPLQLASVLLDDNGAMVVDSTNADLHLSNGRIWLHRESIHVQRFKFLAEQAACERIRVRGFGPVGRTIPVEMRFDNDFADLFEVRGERRSARGAMTAETEGGDCVLYRYTGLDGAERRTRIKFDPPPLEFGPIRPAGSSTSTRMASSASWSACNARSTASRSPTFRRRAPSAAAARRAMPASRSGCG